MRNGVTSQPFLLRWTTKTSLSSRIQDPLGMYVLKFLEDYFLPGITTQTERLRYFSFLTWAWKQIADKKLDWNKILDMEKVLTLIAAMHHDNDPNSPKGIRNKRDAAEFLSHHETIDLDKFTRFGRNNKEGYGNFYYKGPLKTLRILWRENDNIRFSSVGKRIAMLIDNLSPMATVFLKKRFSKQELSKLHSFCFCDEKILAEERKIWRMVFFGFTNLTKDGDLRIDFASYRDFKEGRLVISPTFSLPLGISEELSLQTDKEAVLEKILAQDHQKIEERNHWRRYTLFLIMKIIAETEPEISELNQTIRDAIYFRQVFTKNGKIKNLDFGQLEGVRRLWEVYVHNLYYISVFEIIFRILLEKIREKPLGITLDAIVSSFDLREIKRTMEKWGIIIKDPDPEITQIENKVKSIVGERTNLWNFLNERNLFLKSLKSTSYEERLANLLLLLILLKHRYESFSKEQIKVLSYRESGLFSLKPKIIYSTLIRDKISRFIKDVFALVKNRHLYIASVKYHKFGTRSWLFTEEHNLLYYYGRNYQIRGYREAKWRNVIELLLDMRLLKKEGKRILISEVGEKWLVKIT